jgi:undecaprenyl-diphosphatase
MEPRRPPWVAAEAIRQVATRFRHGAGRLPRPAWRRWVATVAGGYVALVAFTVGLVAAARLAVEAGVLAWEPAFLRALEARSPLDFSAAVWIQTLGTDITLLLVVLFAVGAAAWAGRPLRALSIVAAYLPTDLVVRLAWLLWDRPRPDLILEGIVAPGFASFPSGHTAKTVAVYGILAFLWARASRNPIERAVAAALALAITLAVIFGRLRMGVHWPSDIAAGALIGGAWLAVLAVALGRGERGG